MPTVASAVDQFALAFGRSNLSVVYAKEGEHEFGKPGPDGVKLSDTVVGRMFADRPAKGR